MDTNKTSLIEFYQKCLTVNTTTIPTDRLTVILSDTFISHSSTEDKTKEELIGQVTFFWKLIPDLKREPQDIINEGDTYVVRSIATGTPHGNFMGLTTDGTKSFKIMTIDIHKIIDGKIIEVYHLEDWSTAMRQLNAG